MAESCPSNRSNISLSGSSYSREFDLPKQDCTSPSPTETICLDSADSAPGMNYETNFFY